MKLTFLGTSAGESYPALWCHCPNCEYARQHGGRNIRQNSCAFLDDDLMLDLSSHAFSTALRFHLDITRMKYLFITHDHRDHLDTQHLTWRMKPFADGKVCQIREPFDMGHSITEMGARHTPLPFLNIYGHESVMEALRSNPRFRENGMEDHYDMEFHAMRPGETVSCDESLKVTAVVSHHGKPGSVYNYIIERGGKTLLYALDCGGYDEDMLDIIRGRRFDCVVLEGTFGLMPVAFDMHQNLEKNLKMMDFFADNHLWTGVPNLILSHMSPHWTPPHDEYSKMLAYYGIQAAYDGMTVEF
ncbi:MAG: MBL fold metallo-hydrolase [bacterium]|nr:MBL fold metallo-hydrolase [bacterium]